MDHYSVSESALSSSTPKIDFISIEDQYNFNEDLICRYDLGSYNALEGDRIAIYKLGWQFIKDYVLFEWAPIGNGDIVKFNKYTLPKSETELYQFCYISGDNELFGASTPFQLTNAIRNYSINKEYSILKSIQSNKSDLSTSSKPSIDSEKEMFNLKEDNAILKESLKLFMSQKNLKNHTKDIQELKTLVYGLRDVVKSQQNDINYLKYQVKISLECNRNLIQEKSEIEKKFQAIKSMQSKAVDDLQSKVIEFDLDDKDLGELDAIPPFPFSK